MPNHEQDLNPMVEVQLHILKNIYFSDLYLVQIIVFQKVNFIHCVRIIFIIFFYERPLCCVS